MTDLPPVDFDQKLIAQQKVDPALRERYEKEVKTMFEKKLTITNKVFFAVMSLVCIVLMGYFSYAAITLRALPMIARMGFVAGILFAAGSAFVLLRMLRSGRMNLRKDSNAMVGMAWVFVVAMITIMMVLGGQHPERVNSVFMVVNGLVFLIGGAVFLLQQNISNAQMKMEERMLELQYQLAQLTDELKKRP